MIIVEMLKLLISGIVLIGLGLWLLHYHPSGFEIFVIIGGVLLILWWAFEGYLL